MLGRDRALELTDECRNLLRHLPETDSIPAILEIDDGADVKQAGGGMTVKAGIKIESVEDRFELPDIVGERFGRQGGVFDSRRGFGCAPATGEQGQTRLAQPPDLSDFRWRDDPLGPLSKAQFFESPQAIPEILIELDDEDGFARIGINAKKGAGLPKRQLTTGLIE